MIRRHSLRILTSILGAAVAFGCADTTPEKPTYIATPTLVNGTKTFVDITAGDFHTCALEADGRAYCWGINTQGQSGNGVAGNAGVNQPTSVIGGFTFSSLSAGGAHTCGILLTGLTSCWGNNVGGQLGNGGNIDRFEPSPITGEHEFIQISSSTVAHTCGLKANGEVWCWGQGLYGRLGDGTGVNRLVPTLVSGGLKFTTISAGGGHTCGITADSSAYCWGLNSRGQLGDGTNGDKTVPTRVSTTVKFIQIAAGLAHTCALMENGDPYCWGDNVVGALGDGTFDSRSTPSSVENGPNFVSIVTGERHTCGLDADGVVLCWGYNDAGALGDGTNVTRPAPVLLNKSLKFQKIAAGAYHTCGITTTGQTYCWGDNYGFQLGVPDEP